MILKLASIAVAVLTATPIPPDAAVASFIYGLNARGSESFDLQVPASQWRQFAHGERLDVMHQQAGPQTWKAVYDYVERATRHAGICSQGWMLAEYTVDTDDTRHFKGICRPAPSRA